MTKSGGESIRARGKALFIRYPLARHVSLLMSGTIAAQAIGILTQPIISRLYTPAQMGLFGIFMTVPQVFLVVAGLRYELTMMMPRRDVDARQIAYMCLWFSGSIAAAMTLIGFIAGVPIARFLGQEELSGWMPLTGLVMFLLYLPMILNYWLTRKLAYRVLASNRILTATTTSASRIGAPLIGLGGMWGLVLSQIFGQVAGTLNLARHVRKVGYERETPGPDGEVLPPRSKRELARKYRKMPLLNAPNALIDAFRMNGLIALIGIYFGQAETGQFIQSWNLIQAATMFIVGSLSQVFFQKYSSARPGEMFRLVRLSVTISLAFAIPIFTVLALISPWLIPLYLGPQWVQAGYISQALCPWLALNVATSPISTVYIAAEKQERMLIFAILYAAVPLATVVIAAGAASSLVQIVWLLTLSQCVLLLGMLVMTMWTAKQYDRKGITEGEK